MILKTVGKRSDVLLDVDDTGELMDEWEVLRPQLSAAAKSKQLLSGGSFHGISNGGEGDGRRYYQHPLAYDSYHEMDLRNMMMNRNKNNHNINNMEKDNSLNGNRRNHQVGEVEVGQQMLDAEVAGGRDESYDEDVQQDVETNKRSGLTI